MGTRMQPHANTQIETKYLVIALGAIAMAFAAGQWPGMPAALMDAQALQRAHLAAELVSVALCAMVVLVAWYDGSRKRAGTASLLVFGFTLVGAFDALHVFAYTHSPLSPDSRNTLALLYSQLARMAMAATLLALAFNVWFKGPRALWALLALACAVLALYAGPQLAEEHFQPLYDTAQGLTDSGVALQYLIVAACFASAARLFVRWRRKPRLLHAQFAVISLILGVGELQLARHMGRLDSADVVEHLLRIGACALLYLALYRANVSRPLRELHASQRIIMRQRHETADILEQMPIELIQLDTRFNYRYANPRHLRRVGEPLERLKGTPWPRRLPERQRAEATAALTSVLKGRHVQFELTRDDDETPRSFNVQASPRHSPEGTCEGVLLTLVDTTEQERARQMMQASLREVSELNAALDAHAIVATTDARGVITRVNDKFCQIAKLPRGELIGKTHRVIHSGHHPPEFFGTMWQTIASGQIWNGEICNRARDGELYWVQTTIVPFIGEQGVPVQYISIHANITQRKRAEQMAQQMALYDALTNLPNRRYINAQIQQARQDGANGAVMLLDLDNFKEINDTLGHDQGDELLRQVAQRLRDSVRTGDAVARLGGDEFVVLLGQLAADDAQATHDAMDIAEKVRQSLENTYTLNGRATHASSSIGVTLFRGSATPQEDILKQADVSLYRAKERGRNQVCLFDPALQAEIERHASLLTDLRFALERGQLRLFYQVVVDREQRPIGFEALLRWNHPERGLVPPVMFIGKAEQSGLIVPIGTWAIETACAQLARWSTHPATAHLTMAVNVSARQFRQPDFVATIERILAQSGANPRRLRLEVTESMLHVEIDQTIARMQELRALGVRFSLDDFGTGYSSLSYLKRMPLDVLKIDKSFVDNILGDPNDAAIAQTIMALAATLEMHVVAEGVETQAQFDWLRMRHCDGYQGYWFGKPLPIEQIAWPMGGAGADGQGI